ncbi:MAG: serine/threonine-protein kinase [Gemmatimonadetes bacterium]|nr:serine/threonine-protein kinase [Gemmatimonadota bacterium]
MTDTFERLQAALQDRYRLDRLLGEGGMAVVYLAHDLRHDRMVAVKVVKPELAGALGSDRFLREIRTTASLQHPHILPLFDSGEADGFLYYVMPYVEGESLRAKLNREGQLSVTDAVELTAKVAGALQAAHDAGVVHRDVKPANILMSRGEPLVADFGIALALEVGGGDRLTETGLSMGTPNYMSPEQATGVQHVGRATDIYALGCILYEALVGDPPFQGSTAVAVLGSILSDDPPLASKQRSAVPPNVDAVIQTALEKIPADRFTTAADLAAALADPGYRHRSNAQPAETGQSVFWKRTALALAAASVLLAALSGWAFNRPATDAPLFQVPLHLPDDQALAGTGFFDLSRDGTVLVYQGVGRLGRTQLWVRRATEVASTPITGTEGLNPGIVPDVAISPDGAEVLFWRDGSFHVVPITGGEPQEVTDSVWGSADWSPDGQWVYLRRMRPSGLTRVPSAGGAPEIVTLPDTDAGETGHVWPDVLPSGEAVVFEARSEGESRIKAVRLSSGEIVDIVAGRYPRYADGRLFFASPDGDRLVAAPFDVDRQTLTGDPRTVVPGLRGIGSPLAGSVGYAVSGTGVLAYAPHRQVVVSMVTPQGALLAVDPSWRLDSADGPSFFVSSPDGMRVAFRLGPRGEGDVWIKDLDGGPLSRLTYRAGEERPLAWGDDGRVLIAASGETGLDLWTVLADGSEEPRLLYDHPTGIQAASWHSQTGWIAFATVLESWISEPEGGEIFFLRPGRGGSSDSAISSTRSTNTSPRISPDGTLLAHTATEGGQTNVVLRSFPEATGGRIQISADGGSSPAWAPSGSELYYVNGDAEMMAARVVSRSPLRVERRRLFGMSPGLSRDFSVTPNGDFITTSSEPELVMVFNWQRLLQ